MQNTQWSVYINGWYYHDKLVFLADNTIANNGTEGFASWSYDDALLKVFDELGELNYEFEYIESAQILVAKSHLRVTNNNVLLAKVLDDGVLDVRFESKFATKIAHQSASYKGYGPKIYGYPFFGIDGKIYNYDNHKESFWSVKDDTMHIANQNGENWLISMAYQENADGCLSVVLDNQLEKDRHFLQFLKNQDNKPKEYLKIDTSFGGHDTLMVIFNSAGEEFFGFESRYEFYHLPFAYPTDYIRISQSAPSRWYLDDMALIKQVVLLNNYKKIICLGSSMGGYAAMWLCEYLSPKIPQTNLYAIAVQAMSSLSPEFANIIKQKFSEKDKQRSKTATTDRAMDYQKSGKIIDLAQYLAVYRPNVVHYHLYDVLNDFERLNANHIQSGRVQNIAMPFGLNHIDGCYEINQSKVIEKLLEEIVFGAPLRNKQ